MLQLWLSPSMRRPVRVKTVLFFLSVDTYFLAEPPLSPSFHPQSSMSDCRSLQVGRPRFSRCCYPIVNSVAEDGLLNGAIGALASEVVEADSLKDMVGPCGLEPQTSTVSR
jgi:hypothetical protein